MHLPQSSYRDPLFKLAEQISRGDSNALEGLVRGFSPLIKGSILKNFHWLRDEWEDIAHDVFLKVVNARPFFEVVSKEELENTISSCTEQELEKKMSIYKEMLKKAMSSYIRDALCSLLYDLAEKNPLRLIPNPKELADLAGIDRFNDLDDSDVNDTEKAFNALTSMLSEKELHVCLAKAMSEPGRHWTELVDPSIVKDKRTARSIFSKVRKRFAEFQDQFFPPKGRPNGKV